MMIVWTEGLSESLIRRMANNANPPTQGESTMKEVDPWGIIEKLRLQHKAEIHDQWMPLVAEYREQVDALQSRLESLEKDAARYRKALESARSYGAESWSGWLVSEVDAALDDTAMQSNKGE